MKRNISWGMIALGSSECLLLCVFILFFPYSFLSYFIKNLISLFLLLILLSMNSHQRKMRVLLIFFFFLWAVEWWHLYHIGPEDWFRYSVSCLTRWVSPSTIVLLCGFLLKQYIFSVLFATSNRRLNWKHTAQIRHLSSPNYQGAWRWGKSRLANLLSNTSRRLRYFLYHHIGHNGFLLWSHMGSNGSRLCLDTQWHTVKKRNIFFH